MIDPTAQIARGVRDHRCDEFDIELGSNRESSAMFAIQTTKRNFT
jgi:hypothetical protein